MEVIIYLYYYCWLRSLLILFIVSNLVAVLITHADGSRVSIALICFCDSVCLSARKIKTTATKIAKLGTGIVHHSQITIPGPPINIRSQVKGQGHMVKKCKKKSRRDSRVAPSRSAVSPLNETAPHGRRGLCTLSSAYTTIIQLPVILTGPVLIRPCIQGLLYFIHYNCV